MKIRTLEPADFEIAGDLLFQVFDRSARAHGHRAMWQNSGEVRALLSRHRQHEPELAVVAEEGGAMIGAGVARLRGEVASIGPIAAYVEGHGVGGGIMDELLSRCDSGGAQATRFYVDAWNPSGYALYAGRGCAVIDNAMYIERAPGPAPALDNARGLEVRAADARDLDEVQRLDRRLTGHDRARDLAESVRLVARRRGGVVGYLGAHRASGHVMLGPAVAVDASDLVTLLAGALAVAFSEDAESSWIGRDELLVARLSTSAPAVSMAVLAMGFRVRSLGLVMSRGALPPARTPQLYSLEPEIL